MDFFHLSKLEMREMKIYETLNFHKLKLIDKAFASSKKER